METIADRIRKLEDELKPFGARLIAVSKTKPVEEIMAAYDAGQRLFGENYVQELLEKRNRMPEDIRWHFIGHLQTNKVKSLAPFIDCIQTVDSIRLLHEIDRQAAKNGRVIDCLLQVHIAKEETKFGLLPDEVRKLLSSDATLELGAVRICGLMGMATNTTDESLIRSEFRLLRDLFDELKKEHPDFGELSMGMSSDYKIALEEGSTLIRIGSSLFGERMKRNYA